MVLKIAGRQANGRLVAKEIKDVSFVTTMESNEGQILSYQVDGMDYRQEIKGLLWEVCDDKPAERTERERETKKTVLEKPKKADTKNYAKAEQSNLALEESIRRQEELQAAVDEKASALTGYAFGKPAEPEQEK